MHIFDLIGKVAIRGTNTIRGGSLFQYNPVLILSCEDNKALVCTLDEGDDYAAGETICLGAEYFDNAWLEYGVLINSAVQTKAQVIAKMLTVLGIQADTDSLKTLCRAITYKDLFSEIEDQLDLKDLVNALSIDNNASKGTLADNAKPPEVDNNNAWNGLTSPNTFIKRGIL